MTNSRISSTSLGDQFIAGAQQCVFGAGKMVSSSSQGQLATESERSTRSQRDSSDLQPSQI